MCLGNSESGRQNLRRGMELSPVLSPVSYAIIQSFSALVVAMGIYEPDELVDDMHEVLRRAESFGDICGIIDAQFAYGTVLLRASGAERDEAMEVLERARTNIDKYSVQTNTLPVIVADLAGDAASKGRRDEAIDDLRALFALHVENGIRFEVGCAGEALVRLLIDRGRAEDFAEAHQLCDEWQVRRPDIPAADLWWLKSRALLAEAEGDSDLYAELSKEYLALCEKLDARGLLAEARRMVGTGRET